MTIQPSKLPMPRESCSVAAHGYCEPHHNSGLRGRLDLAALLFPLHDDPRGRVRKSSQQVFRVDAIQLSVIIPTFNRSGQLRACLQALNRQCSTSGAFEVVVVVDGSTDDTLEMLASFQASYPLQIVRQENSGQPVALNRGIAAASGRYCLFLDDDILAEPGLVAEHLRAQQSQERLVAAGQIGITVPPKARWYVRAFAEGWRRHYESLNDGSAKFGWESCYSGNLSAPRQVLLDCGGFTTELTRGFDVELAYRLVQSGCALAYLPAAKGLHDERKGFPQLIRDAELAGSSGANCYQMEARILCSALGSFCAGGWRKLLLKRILLGLRIPPRVLVYLGALLDFERQASWQAFVQNLCYWRGVRHAIGGSTLWRQLTGGTPILLYHAVAEPGEKASRYVIPPGRFAAHLQWIRRFGYQPISLEHYLECRRAQRLPPARSVVITFDDGYADNYRYAFPILSRHGVPATIFLVTDHVGNVNAWDADGALAGRPILDWSQVEEMAAAGVRFGAHTRSHVRLTAVDLAEAEEQIRASHAMLANHLDQPAKAFAYPYGLHDPGLHALVVVAGFEAGLTVDAGLNGPATPDPALHRAEIQGTDSVLRLWLALWLGDPEALRGRKPLKGPQPLDARAYPHPAKG
jgi:peptidoglycan/xylan/chitin deacetylase (PgdA/CDA1 family)/glycosyltransferase involved in cell wall biosynthesis